jgi:hypothetical protein
MRHVTPRGWFVAGIFFSFAVWGMWEIASHLLWVGDGWQWCENLLTCEEAK